MYIIAEKISNKNELSLMSQPTISSFYHITRDALLEPSFISWKKVIFSDFSKTSAF